MKKAKGTRSEKLKRQANKLKGHAKGTKGTRFKKLKGQDSKS